MKYTLITIVLSFVCTASPHFHGLGLKQELHDIERPPTSLRRTSAPPSMDAVHYDAHKFLFIGDLERSGTTLLMHLMASHSNISNFGPSKHGFGSNAQL
jgi:hypothetical protein